MVAAFVVSYVGAQMVCILNDWPSWPIDVGMNALLSAWNAFNAIAAVARGDMTTGLFVAGLAGFNAWVAYTIWRRNRPRRKRRPQRSASRIAIVAGRLRVVPAHR
jgi:hypothetical protein